MPALPSAPATVHDLTPITEVADRKIAEAGLSARIGTTAGDFLAEAPLPDGHGVVLRSMVLHDWTEERDRTILRKCWEALPSGGQVMNMLIETEGRNYTVAEYTRWLEAPGANGAVIGTKP